MKPTLPVIFLLFLCLLLFGAAGNASAATLTVTKVEDTNDGICDTDCSLREAVAASASGDTVVFSPLFNTPQTITLTLGQINISQNLTITGTGQDLVAISGNNASRIFYMAGSGVTVNISDIAFRDGNAGSMGTTRGGAILMESGALNVSHATFTNNSANGAGGAIRGEDGSIFTFSNLILTGNSSQGGGLAISGYSVDVRDSIVEQNTGGGGGARGPANIERCVISDNTVGGVAGVNLRIVDSTIANNTTLGGVGDGSSDSTMIIERCLISGNSAFRVGGGVESSGMTVIKDTQITNNVATDYGGGIANLGTLYLINSSVSGNISHGDGGGGIENSVGEGRLYVINSTVSGNNATGSPGVGGGIRSSNFFAAAGRVYLVNSTIANNTSSGPGGGVRIDPPNGEGNFSNTIVAGNNSTGTSEEDVSGIVISNGKNLIGNPFGSSGWIAGDLLNVNPVLGPLADNGGLTMTHALLPGSPAINAGNNAVAIDPQTQMPLTKDQRGFLRFYGGTVDIGAFEVQPEITGTVVYGNATGAPTPRFVSGVLLSAVGSPNVTATSSTTGVYTLGGFGSGAYTVTPSKTGGANGISSFDAGLIAKHVAGLQALTGNQLIVADVSGNGTLSSFDAGEIARYTVGISGFGLSGTWKFIPANRTYPSVNSTLAGEDFVALLMGDVSGNWMNQ